MKLPLMNPAPCFKLEATGLPWWRRSLAQGAGYMLPSTGFVIIPFLFGTPPTNMLLALLTVAVMVVLFLGTTAVAHWDEPARWLWVIALLVCVVIVGVLTDTHSNSVYFLAYATSAAAMLIPPRPARIMIGITGLAALGWSYLQGDMFGVVMALVAVTLGWGLSSGFEHAAITAALHQEQQRTASLAVVAERERIGRDLHDILGHSLTSIAIKTDLAGRLIGRDDDAARSEIADIGEIARQSLADVRATTSRMREIRLATELATVRSVLVAAGIECVAPSAIPPLSTDRSELFGYTLREAVTNVVRHSDASRCTITITATSISIADNGRGIPDGARWTGLQGLAERAAAAEAELTIDGDGGTTVTVAFPKEQ